MVSPHPYAAGFGMLDRLPETVARAGPSHRVAVISDENVARHYGARVAKAVGIKAKDVLTIPAGEEHKTRESWARLTDDLLARKFGRDTTIVALGGGVIGDLAGFVAATYMRGVPFVLVPTTLLAMVDASIGGKTGVDTAAGKNLVGAFHQPAAVIVDPAFLATLPMEHLRAGFAEIVKHGVVADAAYFDTAKEFAARWPESSDPLPDILHLILGSISIKTRIVASDERELGLRKVLNFGHTIGHAIEAATSFGLLHGQAVAMGLVAEARLAERIGIAASGTARTIEWVCRAAGLETHLPSIPIDTLIGFTRSDKKARAGRVEYALPKRIGEMAGADNGWTVPVDDTAVREALSV
jgi:3-dehydroquinate synthase